MRETQRSSINLEKNDLTSIEINNSIHKMLQSSNRINISGINGQDNIAVGLDEGFEIRISGTAGNRLGAFNNGAVIIMEGGCGSLTGEVMIKGGIIIMGNCGELLGANMNNGIIVVKGNTKGRVCERMYGGTVIIDGNIEGDVGCCVEDGLIIITGDVKGHLHVNSGKGRIFVGGAVTEIDEEIHPVKLSAKEISRISKYFEHYGIRALPSSLRDYQRRDRT